jgi:hypothetical protein
MSDQKFVLNYGGDISAMDRPHAERFIIESSLRIEQIKSGKIAGVDLKSIQEYHDKVAQHLLQLM